jgi:UPF0755 protein
MERFTFFKIRRLWLVIAALTILIIGTGYGLNSWYNHNLGPVSDSSQIVEFKVESGASLQQIAGGLKADGLIRSTSAFETYVRGRHLYSQMKAGTYALRPSMSTPEIVSKLIKGEVSKSYLTILPGKTLADIKQSFKQAGYGEAEIAAAFNPSAYAGEPVLADLPAGASLEGFLYPDSFQREKSTPASAIIRESLEELQARLTPDIISGFAAQGLSPYQGLTLASIVYQESGSSVAEPTIAQVFLLRIKQGMPLQSNVTADYASDLAGVPRSVSISSPYNTYLHTGLPPGPIGNMPDTALNAVAHPSNTSYLYFIAGDDGTIHFSSTVAQHEQAIKQYCHKLCVQ